MSCHCVIWCYSTSIVNRKVLIHMCSLPHLKRADVHGSQPGLTSCCHAVITDVHVGIKVSVGSCTETQLLRSDASIVGIDMAASSSTRIGQKSRRIQRGTHTHHDFCSKQHTRFCATYFGVWSYLNHILVTFCGGLSPEVTALFHAIDEPAVGFRFCDMGACEGL